MNSARQFIPSRTSRVTTRDPAKQALVDPPSFPVVVGLGRNSTIDLVWIVDVHQPSIS
jgi:hypothetical protein